jgi:hypothetical protein
MMLARRRCRSNPERETERIVGIVGGVGPESTIDHYRTIVAPWPRLRPDGTYHREVERMPDSPAPLAKKLKLKAGARAAVIGAPEGYAERLGPPAGTTVATTLDGPLDWIQVFVASSGELAALVPGITKAVARDGLVWISYPKGSSKRQTDLTRDRGWESLQGTDLMWLSLVSVDDTWSAFSLRPYKPGEARQSFR